MSQRPPLVQVRLDSSRSHEPEVVWIRPSLRLQPQVEVMSVHEAGVHAVDDSLSDSQRPPV